MKPDQIYNTVHEKGLDDDHPLFSALRSAFMASCADTEVIRVLVHADAPALARELILAKLEQGFHESLKEAAREQLEPKQEFPYDVLRNSQGRSNSRGSQGGFHQMKSLKPVPATLFESIYPVFFRAVEDTGSREEEKTVLAHDVMGFLRKKLSSGETEKQDALQLLMILAENGEEPLKSHAEKALEPHARIPEVKRWQQSMQRRRGLEEQRKATMLRDSGPEQEA